MNNNNKKLYFKEHKKSKTSLLLRRVMDGEEKTVKEWVEELNFNSKSGLYGALRNLKMRGYVLRPVGYRHSFSNKNKREGILKLITLDKVDSRIATRQKYDNCTLPHLKNLIDEISIILEHHPEMSNELEKYINDLAILCMEKKNEHLKSIAIKNKGPFMSFKNEF